MLEDLFNPLLGLNWLPDETVFSLASRHHRIAGNMRSSDTCRQLFGHAYQGSAHDLPSRIQEFTRRTGGSLGDAKSIITCHTILPFFLPFRTEEDTRAAFAALEGAGLGSLKYKLGLLTSRFRANHPLKACHQCMAVDRKEWSIAYWHRSHQLPGAWTCDKHLTPLCVATLKSTGVQRFHWILPDDSELVPFTFAPIAGVTAEKLQLLTAAAIKVSELDTNFHFAPDQILKTYRRGLVEKNLIGHGGSLRLREIGQSYLEQLGPLRIVPEFQTLPDDAPTAQSQVTRILYKPRTGTHPIRHLFVIAWLFGSFDNFWRSYIETGSPATSTMFRSKMHDKIDGRRVQVIQLLQDGRHTVSAAAKLVGVTPVTAMAWATQAGIDTPCRPKSLKGARRTMLLQDLRLGIDKQEAAIVHKVSVVTVTRMLRTELGLHHAWEEARHEKAKFQARAEWGQVIETNPDATVKFLRLMAGAAYAWLYRNDRAWLHACQPARQARATIRKNAVDWDARDSSLAESVRRVCLELATSSPSSRIALWQIYQRLPELKAKLSRLSSLPLTQRALEHGLAHSKKNAFDDLLR